LPAQASGATGIFGGDLKDAGASAVISAIPSGAPI
jgi:hypothetical protein